MSDIDINLNNIEEELNNEINFLSIETDGKRKNITKSKRENLAKILIKTKTQLNILQDEIETLSRGDNSHVYEDKISEQNETIEKLKEKDNTIEELLLRNRDLEKTYKKINDLIMNLNTK